MADSEYRLEFWYVAVDASRIRIVLTIEEQDLKSVLRALEFAARNHKDQRRKDENASPYINHPIALANILCNEGHVTEVDVICGALLHDTVEDTDTTAAELEREFGISISNIVEEVTDNKDLPKSERKLLQIEHAPNISDAAKLVKLADKIANLRDIVVQPPADWPLERRQEYFDWAKDVIDGLRGVHVGLERLFDDAYRARPES